MQANVTAGQMAGMQLNSPGQPYPNQASQQACVHLLPCLTLWRCTYTLFNVCQLW